LIECIDAYYKVIKILFSFVFAVTLPSCIHIYHFCVVGEAVNFATHDWIAHGSDANERYRSFARPAVFSHDRLSFTMAHHLEEQRSYKNCLLLLQEVERVVNEELELRQKLLSQGVRDVSDIIELPPNCLDQLDEDSADYDDKRLCHACKHICFFSAVACECSRSKVSCLRHSHYMCRCPMERRYLMIWSPEDELKTTCERVRKQCESLKRDGIVDIENSKQKEESMDPLPLVAVGVERDLEDHKDDAIKIEPYKHPPKPRINPKTGLLMNPNERRAEVVTTDEDRDEYATTTTSPSIIRHKKEVVILDSSDESDDEIEVIAVVGAK